MSGGLWRRFISAALAGTLTLMGAVTAGGASLATARLSVSQTAAAAGPARQGYRLVAADGGVFTFGDAPFFGSMAGSRLNAPIVGGAATSTNGGYWLLGRDGGVFAFGDAPAGGGGLTDARGMARWFTGWEVVDGSGATTSLGGGGTFGNVQLAPAFTLTAGPAGVASPFVGIAGGWTTTADGGVFTFGAVPFFGSVSGTHLNSPIVGIAATPDNDGYWLVAADGGVFAFGGARFWGSAGGQRLNKPVVGMAPTPSGNGYWLVAADGGVFNFGDAQFLGSLGGMHLNQPIVAVLSA